MAGAGAGGAAATAAAAPISVFVRVRPLTPKEEGSQLLPGLALTSSDPARDGSAVALDTGSTRVDGFTGLLGQEALNREVFACCFAQRIPTVLRGGVASFFSYGYTGGGKTHTVIGYGRERGMYYLAAERLLEELRALPGCASAGAAEEDRIFLRATACEVYNDSVYDLLGAEKLECTLRTDESGQLQMVGPPRRTELDGSETGIAPELQAVPGMHATLITRSAGLRAVSVFEAEDLEEISRSCVQQRAVGSSTEHQQSSRSHAIVRMEVVNAKVVRAQEALDDAKALLPARKNALDNVSSSKFSILYDHRSVLHTGTIQAYHLWDPDEAKEEEWLVDREVFSEDGTLFKLKNVEGEPKTVEGLASTLGVAKLMRSYVLVKKDLGGPGLWEAKRDALAEQGKKMEELVADAQRGIEEAQAELSDALSRGPSPLGGSLLLVDLAGADYDHRVGQMQKESTAINKSLLALKECFRSLAKAPGAKPKFRDSKLTRILEDSLCPAACSSRRNRESASVMLVNVSPAAQLEKMTVNALRYGQLFSSGGGGAPPAAGPGGGGAGAAAAAAAARVAAAKARPWQRPGGRAAGAAGGGAVAEAKPCDPGVREELLSLYREHCPDKTADDVERILRSFAGREAELLAKARGKYLGSTSGGA